MLNFLRKSLDMSCVNLYITRRAIVLSGDRRGAVGHRESGLKSYATEAWTVSRVQRLTDVVNAIKTVLDSFIWVVCPIFLNGSGIMPYA